MASTSTRVGFLLLLSLTALSPGAAAADIKKECVAAYEQAQVLRKDRKWQAASGELEICSQAKCPLVVRKDCTSWKKDITTNMPTVIFVVRDASGSIATNVRVLVDGKIFKESLDETAVNIDPGEHVLRYEQPGAEPIEQSIQIREGDKERRLSVTLTALAPPPPPPPPPAPKPPIFAYVLGGVGVAGIAAFTVLGVVGKNERDNLESTCKPTCSEDAVSSVRTKLIAADVSLGVGVASLGVGAFFVIRALTSKPEAAPAPASGLRFDVRPVAGGGMGQIIGVF